MKTVAAIILAVVLCAACAWAGSVGDAIEVRIVTDDGRTLPTYPFMTKHALKKVYAEAIKGQCLLYQGISSIYSILQSRCHLIV